MKAYVINLPQATARREHMRQLLRSTPFTDVEFINGIDVRAISETELCHIFDFEMYGRVHLVPPSRTEVGCALAHRKCWERIADSGMNAFILEDDIELEGALDNYVDFASDWLDSPSPRVYNLTRNFYYFSLRPTDLRRPVRGYQCYNAWCYGMNTAAAKVLLSRPPHTLSDEWGYFRRWGIDVRVPVPHPVFIPSDNISSIGEHYCDRFDRDGARRSVQPGMPHFDYLPNLMLFILSRLGICYKYKF